MTRVGARKAPASATPLVSIVTCTFNRRNLLGRAIRSVLAQTWPHWELIVVDDGSTDGTADVVLPLAAREPRLVYVRHANQGLPLARNLGLRTATGDYAAILDSDDEFAPTHLAKRVRHMATHPKLDVLFGGMKLVGPRARQFVPDMERPGKKIHLSHCHVGGTLFAKRSALLAVKGFRDIPFSEDRDLLLRLKARYRWEKVAYPTYIYHLETDDRLCELYWDGGAEKIMEFRRG